MIPESLGNTTLVLPPGIVCDRCNNYFARKVERPVLESPGIRYLRMHQAVKNKKGRIAEAQASVRGTEVQFLRDPSRRSAGWILSPEAERLLDPSHKGACIEFDFGSAHPGPRTWSRLIAKMALEAMASRLVEHPDGLRYLAEETNLDDVRHYARFDRGPNWPFTSRRIYAEDQPWRGLDGMEQRVWEFDFLPTAVGWYFVIAIFGMEFAINVHQREVDEYQSRLWRSGHRSPLYAWEGLDQHGAIPGSWDRRGPGTALIIKTSGRSRKAH